MIDLIRKTNVAVFGGEVGYALHRSVYVYHLEYRKCGETQFSGTVTASKAEYGAPLQGVNTDLITSSPRRCLGLVWLALSGQTKQAWQYGLSFNGQFQCRKVGAPSPHWSRPRSATMNRPSSATTIASFCAAASAGGRAYHLASELYRRFGSTAGYVRAKGFDEVQRRQMVLNALETEGRITRNQVMELCLVTAPQAYRLLKKC